MCMSMTVHRPRRGRPPKNPSAQGETREILLRAGVAILTEKGFSATGLDEILQSASVPKGSFYYYFDSKEAFGAQLIRHYADYFARRLDRFFSNKARRPLDQLKDFIADAEAGMARYAYRRGCLVGILGQEMGALPRSYRHLLTKVLHDWQRCTSECLRAAQLSGEIRPQLNCDELAAFFWIGWEGAILRAKLERSAQPLRTFAGGFFAMIVI
jgi:TetR/AcrR family transcriptional repressor of nem operon